MRIIFQITLLIVLALMLTSCAECTQDPAQAGFFCGVKNISEGTYGQRQMLLRKEAEQAEALARQRGGQAHTLQAQEASLATKKKQLQAKLASLKVDLDRQKRLLAEAKLQRQADHSKLAELDMRLKALQDKYFWLVGLDTPSPNQVEGLDHDLQRVKEVLNRSGLTI